MTYEDNASAKSYETDKAWTTSYDEEYPAMKLPGENQVDQSVKPSVQQKTSTETSEETLENYQASGETLGGENAPPKDSQTTNTIEIPTSLSSLNHKDSTQLRTISHRRTMTMLP